MQVSVVLRLNLIDNNAMSNVYIASERTFTQVDHSFKELNTIILNDSLQFLLREMNKRNLFLKSFIILCHENLSHMSIIKDSCFSDNFSHMAIALLARITLDSSLGTFGFGMSFISIRIVQILKAVLPKMIFIRMLSMARSIRIMLGSLAIASTRSMTAIGSTWRSRATLDYQLMPLSATIHLFRMESNLLPVTNLVLGEIILPLSGLTVKHGLTLGFFVKRNTISRKESSKSIHATPSIPKVKHGNVVWLMRSTKLLKQLKLILRIKVKGDEVPNGCIEYVCILHCNQMVGKNLMPNALQSGTQGTSEVEEQRWALMSSILHSVHHLVDKGLAMREHELQVSSYD
jgi:hypothetical protein